MKAMKVGLIGIDQERHLLGRSLLGEINVQSPDNEKSARRAAPEPAAERVEQGGPSLVVNQIFPLMVFGDAPMSPAFPGFIQNIASYGFFGVPYQGSVQMLMAPEQLGFLPLHFNLPHPGEWSDPQHLETKPDCYRSHSTEACRFYPNCLLGADLCRFAHPYCRPLNHFCRCRHLAQLHDQLHHLLSPSRLKKAHARTKPKFYESDVYCELRRIFGGWSDMPRFELSQKKDRTYECKLTFDGLLFAHHGNFSHRKDESRMIVAQQLLDYLTEVNIA